MLTLSCPSCGANVNFASKASVFAVCSYCKTTMVRHDMNLEMLGKMSEMHSDLTPIQIGTTCMFDKEKYEVIGRMKVGYDGGFWNEWYTIGGGGKEGWLVEAQGFYGMCFPMPKIDAPAQAGMTPGRRMSLGDKGYFEVEDVREVHCIYSEGELPMQAAKGRESLSVDLSGDNAAMATIEYAGNETRIFCGAYRDFDDLQFKNLRHIDGW